MDSKTNIPSFTVSLRGYDRMEVDEYLDSLADALGQVDEAQEQNRRLQAHIGRLNGRIKDLEDRISADTPRTGAILGERIGILLRSAEEAATDTVERAETRAAQLVAEAEQRMAEAEQTAGVTLAGGQEQARRIEAAARAAAAEIISEAEARAAARTRQIEQWAEQVVSHTRAEEARMLREQQEKREAAMAELRSIGEQRDAVAATLAELRETLGQALGLVVPPTPADGRVIGGPGDGADREAAASGPDGSGSAGSGSPVEGPSAVDGPPATEGPSAVDGPPAVEDPSATESRPGAESWSATGPGAGPAAGGGSAEEDGPEAPAGRDVGAGTLLAAGTDGPGPENRSVSAVEAGPEPVAGAEPAGTGAEAPTAPGMDGTGPSPAGGTEAPTWGAPQGGPQDWAPAPSGNRPPFDGEADLDPVTDQIEAVRLVTGDEPGDRDRFDGGWDDDGGAIGPSDDPEFEAKLEAWVSEGARHYKRQ